VQCLHVSHMAYKNYVWRTFEKAVDMRLEQCNVHVLWHCCSPDAHPKIGLQLPAVQFVQKRRRRKV